MILFIQNISKSAYATGDHFDCGDRAIAIEILDPATSPAIPKHKFAETYTFEFLDVEGNYPDFDKFEEFAIQDEQAVELVRILQLALEEHRNVVVHCTMGICRSGAVAEIGVMMGFTDTEVYRQPNVLVKTKMMQILGWSYK